MVIEILSNVSDAVNVTKTESPTFAQVESELFEVMDVISISGGKIS